MNNHYRIYVTGSGIAQEAQDILRKAGCEFDVGLPNDTPETLSDKLRAFNPDGLIVRQGKISEAVQEAAPNLRVICKHGVGTDNIDIQAATQRRIPVMYTPGVNTQSVAEHTLGMMLALTRKLFQQNQKIKSGVFDKSGFDGLELSGKTIGIIGFGNIGRRVAELLGPFGMNVLVFHPSCLEETLPAYISKAPTIEDVLSRSDFISLHCPLTPDTRGMINKDSFSFMKKGAFIINTARGGIISEEDLVEALREGRVGGAALDVFEIEPPAPGNALFRMDNVICTAHIAGVSDNSFKNMGVQAVMQVLAALNNETYDKEVLINPEVIEN